jgi:hypothetical protein
MGNYITDKENELMSHGNGLPLTQKQTTETGNIFKSSGSKGSNPQRLAQLLSTFDYVMSLLEWDIDEIQAQDKDGKFLFDKDNNPIMIKIPVDVTLSDIITQNQASIDGKYHLDYKDIKMVEELDRKLRERREHIQGVSLAE